ncbi:MAG: T6SS immunity protein Tli4 family protein [Formivibrio sp.]|nr:T6SS immunity protein Tli4 family protein [Formivibrio sp.]
MNQYISKTLTSFAMAFAALAAHGQDEGPLMKNTQPLCIGRYLVDIPVDSEPWGKSFNYVGNKFTVNLATADEAEKAYEKKRSELMSPKSDNYIHKEVKLKSGGIIAVRPKDYQGFHGEEIGFDIFGYAWEGKQYIVKHGASVDKLDRAFSSVQRVLNNMRRLKPKEVPSDHGFCITGAFIPGPPQEVDQYEYAYMSFRPRSNPDVLITISTETHYKKEEKSLLERKPSAGLLSLFSGDLWRIKHLRSGKRNVKDMPGEEVMDAIKTDNGGISHVARWETEGQLGTATHPMIVVELETAAKAGQVEYANSSLNNEQAMALFDAVVNSVRLRPISQ